MLFSVDDPQQVNGGRPWWRNFAFHTTRRHRTSQRKRACALAYLAFRIFALFLRARATHRTLRAYTTTPATGAARATHCHAAQHAPRRAPRNARQRTRCAAACCRCARQHARCTRAARTRCDRRGVRTWATHITRRLLLPFLSSATCRYYTDSLIYVCCRGSDGRR